MALEWEEGLCSKTCGFTDNLKRRRIMAANASTTRKLILTKQLMFKSDEWGGSGPPLIVNDDAARAQKWVSEHVPPGNFVGFSTFRWSRGWGFYALYWEEQELTDGDYVYTHEAAIY
jgi:hypothetical protein